MPINSSSRISIIVVLAVGLIFTPAVSTFADVIVRHPSFKEEIKSDAIFLGRIESIAPVATRRSRTGFDLGDDYENIKFKVSKAWKGVNNQIISLHNPTGQFGENKFWQFEVGERYLVFADRDKEKDFLYLIGTNTRTNIYEAPPVRHDIDLLDKTLASNIKIWPKPRGFLDPQRHLEQLRSFYKRLFVAEKRPDRRGQYQIRIRAGRIIAVSGVNSQLVYDSGFSRQQLEENEVARLQNSWHGESAWLQAVLKALKPEHQIRAFYYLDQYGKSLTALEKVAVTDPRTALWFIRGGNTVRAFHPFVDIERRYPRRANRAVMIVWQSLDSTIAPDRRDEIDRYMNALESLTSIGSNSARALLTELLSHPDKEIALRAAAALAAKNVTEEVYALPGSWEYRYENPIDTLVANKTKNKEPGLLEKLKTATLNKNVRSRIVAKAYLTILAEKDGIRYRRDLAEFIKQPKADKHYKGVAFAALVIKSRYRDIVGRCIEKSCKLQIINHSSRDRHPVQFRAGSIIYPVLRNRCGR